MPDHTPNEDALHAIIESTFGAGTVAVDEPKTIDDMEGDTGTVVCTGYSINEIEYAQDETVYEYVFLFKRPSNGDHRTARRTMFDSLESVRDALKQDTTLGDTVRSVRTASINVYSTVGDDCVGQSVFEVKVYR